MKNFFVAGAVALAMAAAWGGAAQARAPFDDRSPADVASVVVEAGGEGKVEQDKPTSPKFVSGSHDKVSFYVDFNHCAQDEACKILMFNASWDTTKVTADQINLWNRDTAICPAYLDKEGNPVMWMPVAAYGHKGRSDLLLDVKEYFGCLGDFADFVDDPAAYFKDN